MKGEYRHTIDAKGRLFVPAKLRNELGEHFIITKGLDGCLFVYPEEDWHILEQKIRALPLSKSRSLQRFLFSAAADSELDGQGRTLVPSNLREYAGLKKEVVIIGVANRTEIWDRDVWDAYNDELTNDNIAAAMEDLGF